MKSKFIGLLIPVVLTIIIAMDISAQSPAMFKFQGVGRDDQGKLLSNTPLAIRFGIRIGFESGPVVYRELHNVITDEFGHFNANIGGGSVLTGVFSQINWATGSYFLQIEYNDGTGFKDLGSTSLLSVPYALYSTQAGTADNANVNIRTTPVFTGFGTQSDPLDLARQNAILGQVLKWNGLSWTPADDINTDNQQLSINGNQLSISGGNTVVLPSPPVLTAGQGIQIIGNTINNTGDLSETNEIQTISKIGNTVSLSLGGGSFIDEVNDADADPTNEIQQLSRSGSLLTLSRNGGEVDLSDLGSKWSINQQDIFRVAGNVGIGISNPETRLHVQGPIFIDASAGNLRLGQPGNGNQWWLGSNVLGNDFQLFHRASGGSPFSRLVMKADGKLGLSGEANPNNSLVIGQNTPIAMSIPAVSVGNTLGGAFLLGNADNSVIIESGLQDPITKISLNGPLGLNRGDLSIVGRGLHIGSSHDLSPYRLRVTHGTFGFALENGNTEKTWEWHVNDILNGIDLFYEGAYKGTFDAITGAYFSVSDFQYKQNISEVVDILPQLLNVRTVQYYMKDDDQLWMPQIGVSAQDLYQCFPEMVRVQRTREGDEVYTVNYAQLSVVAIQGIKEQQSKIEDLERRLHEQETRLEEIRLMLMKSLEER